MQMTPYMLSNIQNWKANNAAIPAGYETSAVVEAVMEGWDYGCVKATAKEGVSDADRVAIAETISEHGLNCTADECVAALLAYCRNMIETNE